MALLAVLCGYTPAIGAQRPAPRAWRFTWRITPTANGQSLKGGDQELDVAIWNGVARITVRSGALRAMTGDGGTLLLRSRDSSVAVINPVRREALTGAMTDLGAMLGGPGGSMPIDVVDLDSRTRDLGAGEPAFGGATRRVELTQRFTIRVRAQGIARDVRTEQAMTIDISRAVSRLDPGFRVFAAQFARGVGLPEGVRARLRAAERGIPAGFPVLTTTAGLSIVGTDTLRTVTHARLSALRQEPVDTLTFSVPADFRVSEMRRLLQQPRRP